MSDPIEDLVREIADTCPETDSAGIEEAARRVREKWNGESPYIASRPAAAREKMRREVNELVASGVKRRTAYRKVSGR